MPWQGTPNNHGERTLRHHVQARGITYGTRCMIGTRAYAWLASVIDTCRMRGASILCMLVATIAAARKGLAPPSLRTDSGAPTRLGGCCGWLRGRGLNDYVRARVINLDAAQRRVGRHPWSSSSVSGSMLRARPPPTVFQDSQSVLNQL